jgi:hypothetical protein
MHFLFNLLRIKGLHMFQALLAHSGGAQTALGILRADERNTPVKRLLMMSK